MTTLDEQFEDLYGPLAPFSDFKKGEQITTGQAAKPVQARLYG